MRHVYVGTLPVLALALVLLVPARHTARAQQPDAKELFGRLCVTCHGAAGKGDGQFASALNPKPANFTDPAFQAARTDAQLTSSITDGKSPMPAFGQQLSPAEIKALVAYIRQMAKK